MLAVLRGPFAAHAGYWESYIILRRLALAGVSFLVPDDFTRIVLLCVLNILVLLSTVWVRPFRQATTNLCAAAPEPRR